MKGILLGVWASTLVLAACDKGQKEPDWANLPESPRGIVVHDAALLGMGLKVSDTGNWYTKDPVANGFEGVSSEKAIAEFGLTHQREIIVAVLDSGVDIEHEDLKGKIWTNPGESGSDANGQDKSSNKVDDDGNGYVDDVHGWNFLGGADGKNVHDETLEVTRELVRFEKRLAAGETLTPPELQYFEKVKAEYSTTKTANEQVLKVLKAEEPSISAAKIVLKEKLNLTDYSLAALEAIQSTDADVLSAKARLIEASKKFRSVDRFYRVLANTESMLNFFLNKEFNPRAIVGDDPDDFSQVSYGNNDVKGPDASHGTHVAGIIAAVRGNGVGVDGVAQNVKIMAVRMVPNGDERDKDVALAVRYAVANGAHIINMSFGKGYSPQKAQVDEAFLLAAQKGVLIFHSAGNDSSNNDLIPSYPNRTVLDANVRGVPTKISTWIEVGASAPKKGLDLVAPFSDYGKIDVDVFAPGLELNSTVPGNQYAVYSGTSMASPAAAGSAALMMSNFTTMTAAQAKGILLDQARLYPGLRVRLPGSAKLDVPVPFAELSATGGVVDAFASITLAKTLSGE